MKKDEPKATSAVADLPRSSILGDDALLTPLEAAKELRLNHRTIEKWRSLGKGPSFIQIGPSRVAYRLADIRHFIAERRAA